MFFMKKFFFVLLFSLGSFIANALTPGVYAGCYKGVSFVVRVNSSGNIDAVAMRASGCIGNQVTMLGAAPMDGSGDRQMTDFFDLEFSPDMMEPPTPEQVRKYSPIIERASNVTYINLEEINYTNRAWLESNI